MGIEVIETVSEMRKWSMKHKTNGLKVGCIPTMGYLHKGHMSLIEEAAKRADKVVMTLFVNPTQFAPGEDLEKYPRDFDGDCNKAKESGADAVFYPCVEQMYPDGYQTYITVNDITCDMEGASRPTHFRGVATVVNKLFMATIPDLAVFGEKDYQQLQVIRRMADDLNMGVEIIGMDTVRESDGLAMSSRNIYLSPEQRQSALSIGKSLFEARESVSKGETNPLAICEIAKRNISDAGLLADYVEVRDAKSLFPFDIIDKKARLLIAARAGKTRLIDNLGIN
jgi:pantoate--beta-alanine ligase